LRDLTNHSFETETLESKKSYTNKAIRVSISNRIAHVTNPRAQRRAGRTHRSRCIWRDEACKHPASAKPPLFPQM